MSDQRIQLEKEIQRCQDQQDVSRSRIRELEQRSEDCQDELINCNRARDMTDELVSFCQSGINGLLEAASSYNFIRNYERDINDLLHGSRRYSVAVKLTSLENDIRKAIVDTEAEISREKKRKLALDRKMDELEQDLNKCPKNDKE